MHEETLSLSILEVVIDCESRFRSISWRLFKRRRLFRCLVRNSLGWMCWMVGPM